MIKHSTRLQLGKETLRELTPVATSEIAKPESCAPMSSCMSCSYPDAGSCCTC